MNRPHSDRDWPASSEDLEQDLEAHVQGKERQELLALAARLNQGRPVPRPGLRSAIRSSLLVAATRSRPRLAALIWGYAASGMLLLVVATAGVLGVGPFAA